MNEVAINSSAGSAGAVDGFDIWRRPAILAATGCMALVLGTVVYLTDRGASAAMLTPATLARAGGKVFGALGQWLPSFVHPFAFSLFSAAALRRSAFPAYGACLAWWVVNMAFEVGQHSAIKVDLAELLQFLLGQTALARTLSDYFLLGSFDVGDIAAVTAGALAAAGVLYCADESEARHVR
jgi:hypothetical protein